MSTKPSSWRRAPPVEVPGGTVITYESAKTGLRAALITTDEPLCSLHVAIATEADTNEWSHKDDGLPHTLEHAIFMGSERYPFKGILDKAANRSLADGTNAWTATDVTCYTLTTAGHEGCLNMLPVYADHILYPTLSEACFQTEVHHVTAAGEDKGVVYCEMQGRENNASSLVDRAILDLLYPSGGYSSETGGKMSNLRDLTNAQVRRYHEENYTPSNMLFVLSGMLDEADFLKAMDVVEERVAAKPKPPSRPRPWSKPVPPMDLGVEGVLLPTGGAAGGGGTGDGGAGGGGAFSGSPKVLSFPSEDESCGSVSLGWRGPTYEEEPTTWLRLQLLWNYLSDSAASPLQKAFVECDEPIVGDICPAHGERSATSNPRLSPVFSEGYHQVWFEDAEMATISTIPAAFFAAVREASEGFDLQRMGVVIRRWRRQHLSSLESCPSNVFVDPLVRHFTYARAGGAEGATEDDHLRRVVHPLADLELAAVMDADEWRGLIRQYILSPPCAAVIGEPSSALAAKLAEEGTALTEANAKRLGPAGLEAAGAALDAAIAHNERPIDESILTAVTIPDYLKVRPVPLLTIRGGGVAPLALASGTGLGVPEATCSAVLDALAASSAAASGERLWVEWCHVESAFITVGAAFDTTSLPSPLRLYLPLLLELWWKLPCTDDGGSALSKDDFVAQLEDDTVKYGARVGLLSGAVAQMPSVNVKVEAATSGLPVALRWLRRSLYLTTISPKHVRMAAKNMAAKLPATYREGDDMLGHITAAVTLDNAKSNRVAETPMRQQPFLQATLARLETAEGSDHVLSQLRTLRSCLLRPTAMHILVAGDLRPLAEANPYQALLEALQAPEGWAGGTPAAAGVIDMTMCGEVEEDDEEGDEEEGDDEGEGEGEGGEGEGGEGDAPASQAKAALTAEARAKALSTMPAEAAAVTDAMEKAKHTQVGHACLVHGMPGEVGEGEPVGVGGCSLLSPSRVGVTVVAGLASIETSYVCLSAPGVGPYHPDIGALRVAIEHLSALEGDFWVKLRGAGLTYGATLHNDAEDRLLTFGLYRCVDALSAYKAAKDIVAEYASGKATISPVQLEGAKSSLAYNIISRVSSKPAACSSSWTNAYCGIGADHSRWLLEKVGSTTVDDALHALKTHLVPIFDASAALVVTCPSSKAAEIAAGFEDAHGASATVVPEERLNGHFGADESAPPPVTSGRAKAGAFSFSKLFKCECAKCTPGSRG